MTAGLVSALLLLVPVLVLVVSAHRHPATRVVVAPLLLAVVVVLLAHLLWLAAALTDDAASSGAAGPALVVAYPLLGVALVAAMRRDRLTWSTVVVLDSLAATLAAAALTAWWLESVLGGPGHHHLSGTGTAHVLAAGLLIALVVGALGLTGRRVGGSFALLAGGLLVFATVDAGAIGAWDLRTPAGSWGQALASGGLAVSALGVSPRRSLQQEALPGLRSLRVLFSSSFAAIAVLALGPSLVTSTLPGTLALLTLGVSVARLLVAFRQLSELTTVREMALTDELTGIANRRALYAELDGIFEHGGDRPSSFALALVDLDHFKAVNDSYGHGTGDELLQAVVRRFSEALREQRTRHLLARLGGDEFAIVLPDADTYNVAMASGNALQQSLAEPIELRDVTLHVQASIGIASAPEHGGNRADLLFASDTAMYAAKTSGEPVCYHEPEAVGDRRLRLFVAEDLYGALERDELTVDYQPILTVAGALRGAEALVRWNHPTRGRLAPDDFLEAAERYKLTPAIAERVLDVTLGDLARWRAGGADLTASVNVSVTDLRNEGLVQLVATALLTHGVPPEKVTIEITETAMMHDPERARSVMDALSGLGVQLSVDDYGTGYSSLEYLLKLPIDEIKLDRAFCADLVVDQRASAIVRSTVDLTHALGLRMVAEGVEDVGTLGVLRDLGCDLVQGWHVGRPMPGEAFEVLVAQQLSRGRDMVGQAQVARVTGPSLLRERA